MSVVEQDLLKNAEQFGYFQAIRLLHFFAKQNGREPDDLRIRPNLSLAFPEHDLEAITPTDSGGYQITANFFGLYGVSSPLPTYYTEDLLAEAREGKHATRDFLDIVHYTIYPLLYDAWRKYRLQLRALEDGDETASNLLFSFIGLADPALRASLPFAATGLLRYAGVLNQRPRSAQGLYTILSDSFSSATVTVQPCQLRAEQIAPEQRWQLGVGAQGLGESLYLGEEIEECNSVVLVQFSDLSLSLYRQLLPGQPAWQQLVFLTRFYLTDPLEVDVTLSMNIDERLPWQLGQAESSCLGQDAWLVPSRAPLDCCVRYTI